ncbi:MAG: hypothetical protein ACREDO_06420 [Methyloceanibacter sp.]
MAELPSREGRVRRWIIATAARYRRMIGKRGPYENAARFAELRSALRQEQEASAKLANRILARTKRLQVALPSPSMGIDDLGVRRIIGDRLELASQLERNAAEIERLEPKWPKGGRGISLATAKYGPPKEWLVKECLTIFWHHGDASRIRFEDQHFHNFVGFIFELATDQDANADGVGLHTVVDKFVSKWQRNERAAGPIATRTNPLKRQK